MNSFDSKVCYNCQTPLSSSSKFCPKCGQKYTTGRISVRRLLANFFRDELNFDSRLVRTIAALFIPGKLTEEFFKGKHKTYFPPIRFFLVIALVLISIIAFKTSDMKGGVNVGIDASSISHAHERLTMIHKIDTLIIDEKAKTNNQKIHAALDSVAYQVKDMRGSIQDSINITKNIQIFGDSVKLIISLDDLESLSAGEIGEKYGSELLWWQKIALTQGIKVVKRGDSLMEYMINKSAIAFFCMMPFLAAFLKILYIRRDKYYVEHLVFSFHYHTFLFLLIIFILLTEDYLGSSLIWISLLTAFMYLFLAMKRIYNQGWIKTFIKIGIASMFYIFLTTIFLVLTLAISFLIF